MKGEATAKRPRGRQPKAKASTVEIEQEDDKVPELQEARDAKVEEEVHESSEQQLSQGCEIKVNKQIAWFQNLDDMTMTAQQSLPVVMLVVKIILGSVRVLISRICKRGPLAGGRD